WQRCAAVSTGRGAASSPPSAGASRCTGARNPHPQQGQRVTTSSANQGASRRSCFWQRGHTCPAMSFPPAATPDGIDVIVPQGGARHHRNEVFGNAAGNVATGPSG